MDLSILRAQIDQGMLRLSEIASQLDGLTAAELEALSAELIPLLNRINAAPGETLELPPYLTDSQYRSILDVASVGITLYDRHQVMRYANQRAIQYIGYNPIGETRNSMLQKLKLTEWTGRPLSMFDRPATLVWEGVQARDVPMMITNTQGQVLKVLINAIPFFQGEEFAGAAVIWNDVTPLEQAMLEVKRREEQLRESEARFRLALSKATIFVYTQDRDLRYTWFYSPYHPEEAQWVMDLDHLKEGHYLDVDLPGLVELKRRLIETGEGFRQEFTSTASGELRVFDVTCEPLRDIDGRVSGLTGAAVDITEQRRLEAWHDEYSARIELHHRLSEQSEQNLLHFSQKIHDGPLQNTISLIGAVQLARELSSEPQVTQVMDEIEQQARDLGDELRGVCRELNPPSATRFGLKRAIKAHVQDLRKRYPEINFELAMMEDILRLPDALVIAFYRVYREAVQNAIQHAGARTITVRLNFPPGEMVLEIEDDGVGFTPSANWMELINQGQFGLVSMKEQAGSINASLTLTSAPGRGTKVRVSAAYGG